MICPLDGLAGHDKLDSQNLAFRFMTQPLQIAVELPDDLARFRLPAAVQARLNALLDRQDHGQPLTEAERNEAEGLVNLAELLSLLRLRTERLAEGGQSIA